MTGDVMFPTRRIDWPISPTCGGIRDLNSDPHLKIGGGSPFPRPARRLHSRRELNIVNVTNNETSMHPTASPSRRLDVDNLRNLAVLALILFHTARLFNHEEWHIKNAEMYSWGDWIVRILNQWHMPLFFVLAGMSAYYAINARGGLHFARERVLRLFVPFVLGCFLFVAPQVYIERIAWFDAHRYGDINFVGSYLDFLPTFVTTGAYPKGNFSWHHLWFVLYLFVYSVLLVLPLAAWGRGAAARALGRGMARGGLWLLLPALAIFAVKIFLYPLFGSTHNLVWDWANHVHFVFVFLMGWLIAATPELESAVRRGRPVALILAITSVFVWLYGPKIPMDLGLWKVLDVSGIGYTLGEWFWIAAFLGYARDLLDRRIPFVTGFTRYAFPFYILHQTVIVVLGYQLWNWTDQPVAKFVVVAVATTAISLIGCRLLDTNPVTRFVIGLKSPLPRAAI